MMQTKGLYKSLLGTEEQPNEPALANEASNDEKKNQKVLKDAYNYNSKTGPTFCHLVRYLYVEISPRRVNRFLIRLLI